MGYSTRPFWNGKTEHFWPDETEGEFYIEREATIQDILEKAELKWGYYVGFEDIGIESQHIHTDCLGYDSYDSGDYTNFLRIFKRV